MTGKIPAAGDGASEARVSPYAWAVVGMLFPVALLNYLDRMLVATMRGSIRADITSIASDADFGLLMALFMWVYAVLSPVGGFLSDRFNRRWMVITSLFVWSLMTWLTGCARTFSEMAWARGLMGVSEAFYIPAALALIVDFHPGRTRSRAVAIHMCGIYAGQMLGGFGGYIADKYSWRDAFYWFGGAGMVYSIFLFIFLREGTDESGSGVSRVGRGGVRAGSAVGWLLGSGAFVILTVYFTLPSIAGWEVKNWLPTYLATGFGLRQGPAGLSATGFVTLAMVAGALLGGALADRAVRVSPRGRIFVSGLGMALCGPGLLGLGWGSSLGTAIGCMVLFGLGFGFFDANNMPILCEVVPAKYRATGYGLMNMVSIGCGAVATVGLGRMRDGGISLRVAFGASAGIILVAGLLLPILAGLSGQSRSGPSQC